MATDEKTYKRMATDEYIDRYLEKQLSEEEVKTFELRCMEDEELFNRVKQRKKFREQVKTIAEKEGATIFANLIAAERAALNKPRSFPSKIFQWWSNLSFGWRLTLIPAAVAGLILLMMVKFNLIFPPDIPREGPYAQLSLYEEMIRYPDRNLASTITLKSVLPRNNKIVELPIEFKWTAEPDTALTLVIVNNKDEFVQKIPDVKNGYHLSEPLPPGLYYWKLTTSQELVYIGKFAIKK